MTPTVTIVDYGVGNMFSVRGALEYCGAETIMTNKFEAIEKAERLLLPGVGAFSDAMSDMRSNDLVEPVQKFVDKGRPLLAICLGAQMLLSESEEFGQHEGLNLIPGSVRHVPPTSSDGQPHCIPHVGWSELFPREGNTWEGTVFEGIPEGSEFYFVHSLHAIPEDDEHLVGISDYNGLKITGAVERGNVIGCQFHPEKSAEAGLTVLRNYLKR